MVTRRPAPTATPSPARGRGCVDRDGLSRRADLREHVQFLERGGTELVELDQESLAYLSAHGFLPGTEATVTSRAPDGTMILDLEAGTIALGPSLASQLFVTAA